MSTARGSKLFSIGALLCLVATLSGCFGNSNIKFSARPYQPLPKDMIECKDKTGKMTFKVPPGWTAEDPKTVIPGIATSTDWIVFAFQRTSDPLAFRKGQKGVFAVWCNLADQTHWGQKLDKRVYAEAPLSSQVGTISIAAKARGEDPYLFVYDSEIVKDGVRQKSPFTLYTGHKATSMFDVYGPEYMFYGKAFSKEFAQEIENDFVNVLRSMEAK